MADSSSSENETDRNFGYSSSSSEIESDFEGFEIVNPIRRGGVLVEIPLIDFQPQNNVNLACDIHDGWGMEDEIAEIKH